jgi:murein L,D-transpeptidase YcbB/YkuD
MPIAALPRRPAQVPQSGAMVLKALALLVGLAAAYPACAQDQSVAPSGVPQAAPPSGAADSAKPARPRRPAVLTPRQETSLSSDPQPTLQPDTFITTAKVSERYLAIADSGGWPIVPGPLQPGAKGKAVSLLKRRLSIEGDLSPSDISDNWSPTLTVAVKRFQFRLGLKQTAIVAGATLRAMNVPATVRFKQLASSAQRLAGLNFPFGERYVVVNIPSTTVEAVQNGTVVRRYVAIAGDVEHPSPEVMARITEVNLNPTWTVPQSIIKNEIIPKMRRDPGYLTRAKIRILGPNNAEIDPRSVNWNTEKAANYILRQDSGSGNSLGSIRINMPNSHAVYMHDTPAKQLFGADYRFLSHGCVRVEGVYDLAEWLLKDIPGSPEGQWNKAAMLAQIASGEHEDVKLTRPVPVAWVYLTGWANADGVANFRDDIYAIDTVGGTAQYPSGRLARR